MPCGNRLCFGLFGDDRATQRNALIANAHRPWPGDQALNFILAATTK
jgi:hypothetical protein